MRYLVLRCCTSSLHRGYSDSGALMTTAHFSGACSHELKCNYCMNRHSKTYAKAAVAADAEQCSKIGVDILRQGGNAVDAAIAGTLSVGVINLHSTGIGGGGFMVVYSAKSKTSYAIDFRDKAPLNSSAFMFEGAPDLDCRYGGLAIAVPGMLHGLHSAWMRFGSLPWRNLFEPAINLAREGFTVTKDIVRAINMCSEMILSGKYPGLQELLAPNGDFLKEGDTLYRLQLADTLEAIAELGIDYFYNSNFTVEMVSELQQKYSSILTVEDFQRYTAIERQVVPAKFKDHIMLSMPPPACGAMLGLLLNILDSFDFTEDDIGTDHFHRIIEAFKFTYGQKFYLEDPDFSESIKNFTEHILDPSTANTMFSQIDYNRTHEPDYYTDPQVIPDKVAYDYGTTHLSVLDQDGNAVSATTTLNSFFGSLVRSQASGVIFNNNMDNFNIPGKLKYEVKAKANFIVPQKRPLSSSAPTIMLNKDGSVKIVIGASGGVMIPSALAQVIIGVLGFKWPLSKAISYPRLHHQLHPNTVVVDMDVEFPLDYQYGLLEKGHELTTTIHRAVVQGIHVDENGIHATSDFRKGGIPDGY